jgi:hypothetical protein
MRLKLAALAVLIATPAFAHPGDHHVIAFADQARHLLSEPDHLLALAALVALAVTGGWVLRRRAATARR